MLVILTNKQVLSVNEVCPGCLMADYTGSPRWHHGKLGCGRLMNQNSNENGEAKVYQCEMGFRIAEIK